MTIKFIDPTYSIRAVPGIAADQARGDGEGLVSRAPRVRALASTTSYGPHMFNPFPFK